MWGLECAAFIVNYISKTIKLYNPSNLTERLNNLRRANEDKRLEIESLNKTVGCKSLVSVLTRVRCGSVLGKSCVVSHSAL